ncbi:MAG: hypothetical protein LBD27_03330 [Tannerella sp.]|nr:hypothetical protein [Tannerella sp.]
MKNLPMVIRLPEKLLKYCGKEDMGTRPDRAATLLRAGKYAAVCFGKILWPDVAFAGAEIRCRIEATNR